MERRMLVLHDKDTVGVLLENAEAGDYCLHNSSKIELIEPVEFGHKFALVDLRPEAIVYKYGEEIGYALEEIRQGQWIHNHNMGCRRGK